MSWSSDWLYALLLNRAREAFAEAVRAATRQTEEPPVMLLATEHRRCRRDPPHSFGRTEPHLVV